MIEGFDEIVLAWEKHELFYKELYEKKKGNPAEYRRFLSQLNVEDLRDRDVQQPVAIFFYATRERLLLVVQAADPLIFQ